MEFPAAWAVAADWREQAEQIGARLRHRDAAIRGVAAAGDYAAGSAWGASYLQIVVFPHTELARLDEGGISEGQGGLPYAIDRITTGLLTDLGDLLTQEPLAGTLAGLMPLRIADPTLRDLLLAFRDRYHSAEGRAKRTRWALQAARVSLDDFAKVGRPVLIVEAVQDGLSAAVSAALGEPMDRLRLLHRLRAAGRVLRIEAMGGALTDAFALESRDLNTLWADARALEELARSHLEARMPEVGAAFVPLLERIVVPAQRASGVLASRGDRAGAAWAALSAAAAFDGLIERASPGWRERSDYAARAAALYGEPNPDSITTLRRRLRTALE